MEDIKLYTYDCMCARWGEENILLIHDVIVVEFQRIRHSQLKEKWIIRRKYTNSVLQNALMNGVKPTEDTLKLLFMCDCYNVYYCAYIIQRRWKQYLFRRAILRLARIKLEHKRKLKLSLLWIKSIPGRGIDYLNTLERWNTNNTA